MNKQKSIIFFSFALFATFFLVFAKQILPGPKILLIFAHYDDETMIASTLMKLKNLNADIRAIYLTRGEGGKDIRIKDSKYFSSDEKRVNALIIARENDIKLSSSILGSQYHQLSLPDVPLRVPEPGYPNPLGRPSTDGPKFIESGIWNLEVAKNKIKNLIAEWNWKPDFIFTTGRDKGIIHSHHQATYEIVKSLVDARIFSPYLKGAFAAMELQDYPIERFSYRPEILFIDHREKESRFNSTTFLEKGYEIYLAHQSQATSQKSLEELQEIPECLYLIQTLDFKNSFDPLVKVLETHFQIHRFHGEEDWKEFISLPENWKLGGEIFEKK